MRLKWHSSKLFLNFTQCLSLRKDTTLQYIFPLLIIIALISFLFINKRKRKFEEELRVQREKEEHDRLLREEQYRKLENDVLKELNISSWGVVSGCDEKIIVKTKSTFEKYDYLHYLKENREKFETIVKIINNKTTIVKRMNEFVYSNNYKTHPQYNKVESQIALVLRRAASYRVKILYITSAGNCLGQKEIEIDQNVIDKIKNDPSLIMSKTEYNKMLKDQQRAEKEKQKECDQAVLSQKQRNYYDIVNKVIDYANKNKDFLVIKDGQEKLDNLVAQLFDRTINSIKKIKTAESEEWDVIKAFILQIKSDMDKIILPNHEILRYYQSQEFLKIKKTCYALMSTQREFNEYINEKVKSISQLFGTKVVRNETINEDEYNYIRPYKKTITPFTAEVSKAVFESAENNPLEYIVKHFYPNKSMYPEQIQKLRLLIQELETLREAKQIIENYKAEYQQYLTNVPANIMQNDEAGFYQRLGFARIDESVLVVEYKFAYTSGGGFAHRYFTVPMTEETIVELIKMLESKLTASAFAKQQRALMTKKLRDAIKTRDNFTCKQCGNSVHKEPNLLLEIDHIIPVAKGGQTEESNLQTLCWKCNRSKGAKI